MNVYALWKDDGKYQYRWRTILQFGTSWDIIGSVYMKNPGGATPIGKPAGFVLTKLESFSSSLAGEWKEFSPDTTMDNIEKLFSEAFGGLLSGVIQIFNLCNLKNTDSEEALKTLRELKKDNKKSVYLYTFDEDINKLKHPVYIGWGNLWSAFSGFQTEIKSVFNTAKVLATNAGKTWYLGASLSDPNNHYYHPKYLYVHPHKYDNDVMKEKQSFITMVK